MRVSQLARKAGVTADTVRHYVRIGLLSPSRDGRNDYRVFGETDLTRLLFIRRARQLGFKLGEIRTIFELADNGESPCPQVRDLILKRIEQTRRTVKELKLLQERMEQAAMEWAQAPDQIPTGDTICHLIENWNQTDE